MEKITMETIEKMITEKKKKPSLLFILTGLGRISPFWNLPFPILKDYLIPAPLPALIVRYVGRAARRLFHYSHGTCDCLRGYRCKWVSFFGHYIGTCKRMRKEERFKAYVKRRREREGKGK